MDRFDGMRGLNETQLRQWIRKILQEDSNADNVISENSMYNAFVAPFVDVFKVAKVAAKDVLSAAKFNLDVLTTFSYF